MAEKAAHLTATTHPKPSIFEIIAQDSLNSTIHPALQKIILFLASFNPKKYKWLIDYCDEIYLILNSLFQFHYVSKHGASFSEHFYGLKRVSIKTHSINLREKKISFIFLVILPYIKIKLNDKLTQYRLELADGVLNNDWKRKLKSVLCNCQSFLHVSWNIWTLGQYLNYMSGSTDIQTPTLKMLGLKLTYAVVDEENEGFWSLLINGQITLSQLSFGLLGQAFKNTLEFGAFFVQFLKSWQSEKADLNITALPKPTPPQMDPNAAAYFGKCPICMQRWKVPTVLSTSGYVYCFRCIIQHLKEEEKCPVTHYPATIKDIFRLYI